MKPLSPVDRWMVKQNLGYVQTEGLQTVVDRLRQQGYDRVANAVEQEAKELQMNRLEVLVAREGSFFKGNPVFVVVSCDKTRQIENGNQLEEALVRAVTNWIKTTEEGKAAFQYATDDLNIGDLLSHLDDENLARAMENEGIKSFQVMQPDVCDWNYDTPLVDTNSLPEE